MIAYILRRLLQSLPVLVGVSVVAWGLTALAPGDASQIYARQFAESGRPTDEEVARAREALNLDGNILEQYFAWASRAVTADFGRSFASGAPVADELRGRLWPTAQLAIGGTLVMLSLGVPLGIVAALSRNGWPDAAARIVSLASGALPSFWVALVLIWLFAVKLDWFPSLGRGSLTHAVLPSVALGLGGAGTFTRLIRASLLDVLGQPYIMAARARGLTRSTVVLRHALRNALVPAVTQLGLVFGALLGGAAIVETIFSWPGLGKMTVDAINARDYPVMQAVVLIGAVSYIAVNLIVDVVYRVLDPRIGATA